MISSSTDSCANLVAGRYDVLFDENPHLIKKTLNRYLDRFARLEFQLSRNQNDDSQGYAKEFNQLRELSKSLKTDKQNIKAGELACNRLKNRYQDIIPFDHTRIVLNTLSDSPGSDYINANYIGGSSGSPQAYIACQGPLKNTLGDFWRMIWECNVSVIVMACNEYESGHLKCELYWPELENTSSVYGQYEITLVKVHQVCDDFLIRRFSVKLLQNQTYQEVGLKDATASLLRMTTDCSSTSSSSDDCERIARSDGDSDSYHQSSDETALHPEGMRHTIPVEERTICQFHYTTWPDHGVPPSVDPILDLIRLIRDDQPAEDRPILVHCSAGCGRTGTICCIDYVWGLIKRCRLEPDFDLHQIISEMRKQRMSMVQTLEQYILCHRAVAALFADQLTMMELDEEDDNYHVYHSLDTAYQNNEQLADSYEGNDDGDQDYNPVFI